MEKQNMLVLGGIGKTGRKVAGRFASAMGSCLQLDNFVALVIFIIPAPLKRAVVIPLKALINLLR